MISEYPGAQIFFAGLGSEGSSAAEAAARLATLLREWAVAHEECRIVQLSMTPGVALGTRTDAPTFSLAALIAYVETGLSTADAAQAVAAAIDEIHEAQSGEAGRPPNLPPERPFV